MLRTVSTGVAALFIAAPVSAQSLPTVESAKLESGKKPQWQLFLDVRASPSIGDDLQVSSETDTVDDSDYEAALRIRHDINRLRGLRFEAKAGVVAFPNSFDSDDTESSIYAEVQLGDTYLAPSEIRRLQFRPAAPGIAPNAIRPYVRYRFARCYSGFVDQYASSEHRVAGGLRYRYIPFVTTYQSTEDGQPVPPEKVPLSYLTAIVELTRIETTVGTKDAWMPKAQIEIYGAPFWNLTRAFLKVSGEISRYDELRSVTGARVVDKRLRLTAGLDLSKPLEDWLNLKRSGTQAEIAGRWQRRWSNVQSREHSRAYFVPTLSLNVPIEWPL